MYTKTYSNIERFDKVIAKINGAVFLPHNAQRVVIIYCAL